MPFMFNPCRPCCTSTPCRCYWFSFDMGSPFVPNYVWPGGQFPIVVDTSTYPTPIQYFKLGRNPFPEYSLSSSNRSISRGYPNTFTYGTSGLSVDGGFYLRGFRVSLSVSPKGLHDVLFIVIVQWTVPTQTIIDLNLSGAGLPDPPPWADSPGDGFYEAAYKATRQANQGGEWCRSVRLELMESDDPDYPATFPIEPEGGDVEWPQYVLLEESYCQYCGCYIPSSATGSSGIEMSSYIQEGISNKINCGSGTPAFVFNEREQAILLRSPGITAGDSLEEHQDNGTIYTTKSFVGDQEQWCWSFMARVKLSTSLPYNTADCIVLTPIPEDDYPEGWDRFSASEIKGAGIFIGNVGTILILRASEAPYVRLRFIPFVDTNGEWRDETTGDLCGPGYVSPETKYDSPTEWQRCKWNDVDYGPTSVHAICLRIVVRRRSGLHYQVACYYYDEYSGPFTSPQLVNFYATLPAAPQNYGMIGFGGAKWSEPCFIEGPYVECGMCKDTDVVKPSYWIFYLGPSGEQNGIGPSVPYYPGAPPGCAPEVEFASVLEQGQHGTGFSFVRDMLPGLPGPHAGANSCFWHWSGSQSFSTAVYVDYNYTFEDTVSLYVMKIGSVAGSPYYYHCAIYTANYTPDMCPTAIGFSGNSIATFTLLDFGSGDGDGAGHVIPSDPPVQGCLTGWPATTYLWGIV